MIGPKIEPETIAQQLGAGGVDNLVANAERVCGYEQRYIALSNEHEIAGLELEFNVLLGEEQRIETQLRSAPVLGSSLRLRLRAIYYWAVAALLLAAGLALVVYTLAPFRIGFVGWIIAAGVAVVTPFLVDKAIESHNLLVKIVTFAAAPVAVACMMFFADVRGNVLDEQLRANEEQAVVIDAQPAAQSESTFYEKSSRSLHLALILLAFAMEIGAALALHEARRHVPDTSEDWKGLRRELAAIRQRKSEIVRVVVNLRNQPGIFAARFWSDFYRAMLVNAVRKSLMKILLVALGCTFAAIPRARAQVREDWVIAIDLTASVSVSGPDSKSEFQKNVDGVARVLGQAPANSRISVIGITDHSFAQPYILLSARVGADAGYFGERLAAARNQLVRTWKLKSAHLDPGFHRTDILGALELASQIFAGQPGSAKRVLIIFSDMRQNTPELNLESPSLAPEFSAVAQRCEPLPSLRGAQVAALGVDGAGKSTAYWESLRTFWKDYLSHAGAELKNFTTLRESPASSDRSVSFLDHARKK